MQLFLMISHVGFELCDEGPITLNILFLTVKKYKKALIIPNLNLLRYKKNVP